MATYKQEDKLNVPVVNSEFRNRFKDGGVNKYSILTQAGTEWLNFNKFTPWRGTPNTPGEFPAFNFNQMTVAEFFKNLTTSGNMYTGMLDRIGRTIIWADDLMDNPFLRFMKPPLEYGAAIEQAAFEEIPSRPWTKNYQSSEGGTNPLFSTQIPKYLSEIATVNFSREIPLKMSEIEYRKCCQTANTVGDVAGALIGKINTTFVDDMYQACKQYFCGCLRIAPEPIGTNGMPIQEGDVKNNPMVEIIEYNKKTATKTLEETIFETIYNITKSQFAYKSRLYNPAQRYVLCKKSTLILPIEWRYQLFLKKYAETYHPEYVMLGDEVDLLYIDDMPQMTRGFLPVGYKYLGLLVDNRALGITPLNGGFSVESFYNPSENSTSYFGHYEMIFSFASLFNRKYIFLHETST